MRETQSNICCVLTFKIFFTILCLLCINLLLSKLSFHEQGVALIIADSPRF
jgi:hypothetical protein